MRHRFHIDTDKEFRVHPRDFARLVDESINSFIDFTVTRQSKTISGDTCVLIIGDNLYIQDPNAEELLA